MVMRKVLWVAVVMAFAGCGWGQDASAKTAGETATLKASAKLVNLPVIVRDSKGKLVQTLTKNDFALTVDGAPGTIRYFDKDANVPLTLGLLVDVSQSQRSVLDQERTASGTFLEQMLGTAGMDNGKPVPDRAFVMQFAHTTELLQDLTDSKPKLQAALKELDSQTDSGGGGNGNGGNPPDPNDSNSGGNQQGQRGRGGYGGRGGGTTLYDAVFLEADEIMAKQHGRKAIIILSDGVDSGSKKSLARAIEADQRADTVIYAIYFKGEEHGGGGSSNHGGGFPGGGFPGGGGRHGGGGGGGGYPGGGSGGHGGGNENRADGKKVLERMADETGGRMFEVKGKQDVAAIYAQIAEELRQQYRLGYTPDAATAADGYHQVVLTVPAQKKYTVQTRDGYYTGAAN